MGEICPYRALLHETIIVEGRNIMPEIVNDQERVVRMIYHLDTRPALCYHAINALMELCAFCICSSKRTGGLVQAGASRRRSLLPEQSL